VTFWKALPYRCRKYSEKSSSSYKRNNSNSNSNSSSSGNRSQANKMGDSISVNQ